MSFDIYSKSVVAPSGGVNFGIKPHLLQDKYWFKMQGMACREGIVKQILEWEQLGEFTAPALTTIKFVYIFITETGTSAVVIATASKFYHVTDVDAGTKTDITGAAVLTDGDWSACTFNGVMYMSNATHGLYKWTGAGNIVAIAAAPLASFITFFHEHLIAFGNGIDLLTINWASEFDDSVWTPLATNDAGGFNFTDSENLVCAYILGENLVIYRRESISALSYIGGDLVFLHRPLTNGAGASGKYAVVALSGKHLVIGRDFAYEYAGGDTVNRDIGIPINLSDIYPQPDFSNADVKNFHDRSMKEIHWLLSVNSIGDCIITYNYELNAWSGPFKIGTTPPSLGLTPVCFMQDISIVTASSSFEIKKYFVTATGLYEIIEISASQSISDSTTNAGRYLETGDIFLGAGAVNEQGEAVNFPLSTIFSTEAINLETSVLSAPNTTSGTITMAIGYKMELNDAYTWSSDITLTDTIAQVRRIPARYLGRWFRLRFTVTNNAQSFGLSGYQFQFIVTGVR